MPELLRPFRALSLVVCESQAFSLGYGIEPFQG